MMSYASTTAPVFTIDISPTLFPSRINHLIHPPPLRVQPQRHPFPIIGDPSSRRSQPDPSSRGHTAFYPCNHSQKYTRVLPSYKINQVRSCNKSPAHASSRDVQHQNHIRPPPQRHLRRLPNATHLRPIQTDSRPHQLTPHHFRPIQAAIRGRVDEQHDEPNRDRRARSRPDANELRTLHLLGHRHHESTGP